MVGVYGPGVKEMVLEKKKWQRGRPLATILALRGVIQVFRYYIAARFLSINQSSALRRNCLQEMESTSSR